MNRVLTSLVALLAAVLVCGSGSVLAADPSTEPSPGAGGGERLEIPGSAAAFGAYELVPLLGDSARYGGPATPTSLDDVQVSDLVKAGLDRRARRTLAEQGFVVVPADYPLFHLVYDEQVYASTPMFVTTDAAYHAWHLVFDKVLRDLEQAVLLPRLETLVAGMLENARAQAADLEGTALAEPAARVVDLISVAGASLGLKVGRLSERATAEKALVDAHTEIVASPISGTVTDYSLYTPRGHYTRNADLTRYFTAMSVLGQAAFLLPGSKQMDETIVESTDPLLAGWLASETIVGSPELEQLWRDIFEPTAFLVGVSDDYSPFEVVEAARTVLGPGDGADPATMADEATLKAIADALKAARPVRIDPERPSVRLMGTRFVVDSWVLDQMVYPNVGGEPVEERRLLASPLDLAAAFGSDFALAVQDEAGETAYLHYPEQMAAVREAIAARPDEAWGATVYDAWLAAVEPMWLPHGQAFPDFMRSEAWTAKDHQTGFGSYAELKHDTILYTKQFVGEMGALEPPPSPRHWVEPDPVAFARLGAMAALMRDGLDARGLLTKSTRQLLKDYLAMTGRLERIAASELAGEPMSAADNEWLEAMGGILEGIWWKTGDKLRTLEPDIDDMAAIVADIGSGGGEAVEVATGYIDLIYVLVPDDEGRFQVARGGTYSSYEFVVPTSERLTDEAWREMLESGQAPDRPAWQEPIFP